MKRTTTLFTALIFFGIYSCALLDQSISLKKGDLQGQIEDNVYTSPTGSFRVRLPRLSSEGVEITDERPSESALRLVIKDNLCREFSISERPGFLGTQSLSEWVNQHIVDPLKSADFKIESTKSIETRQGTVISLRYKVPGGAPCVGAGVKDGKQLESKVDADVGWYVFFHEGTVYRLIYVLGLVKENPGNLITQFLIKKEPVDEVLAEFAEGFDIIAKKSN